MADNHKEVQENENSKKFDINLVYDSLVKCSEDTEALNMDYYIKGFHEFYKFFMLLGTVFGFVASDVISKLTILEEYRKSDNAEHYVSVQSMLTYEKANDIHSNTSQPSGSRTLLRLHRALEFIMSFMRSFSQASTDAKISAIAQECYKNTLAHHHPWIIQKGANFAMYTLPARQQFIERVSGAPCDESSMENYEQLMGKIADAAETIYDITQKLYEEHDFLQLP